MPDTLLSYFVPWKSYWGTCCRVHSMVPNFSPWSLWSSNHTHVVFMQIRARRTFVKTSECWKLYGEKIYHCATSNPRGDEPFRAVCRCVNHIVCLYQDLDVNESSKCNLFCPPARFVSCKNVKVIPAHSQYSTRSFAFALWLASFCSNHVSVLGRCTPPQAEPWPMGIATSLSTRGAVEAITAADQRY